MLESFCAASQIKSFADRLKSPVIHECSSILQGCLAAESRGTLNVDINRFTPFRAPVPSSNPLVSPLDDEIVAALQRGASVLEQELPGWKPLKYGTIHSQFKLSGLTFSKFSANLRNSFIFYQADRHGSLQPGIVREIFTIYSQDGLSQWTFIAAHPFPPCTNSVDNPLFSEWSDFGASLFSNDYSSQVHIIPSTRQIVHAIRRRWYDGSQVLKSLDRVSSSDYIFATQLLTIVHITEYVISSEFPFPHNLYITLAAARGNQAVFHTIVVFVSPAIRLPPFQVPIIPHNPTKKTGTKNMISLLVNVRL